MKLESAESFTARYVGLLWKKQSAVEGALYIHNCQRVHTWFMRFAIDVAFIDEFGVVVALFTNMQPWRISKKINLASGCIEMAAGVAKQMGLTVGRKCIIDEY